MEIETRTIAGEVRASNDGPPKVTGVGVTYGALSHDLGGFREQFAPGSLDETVESDDLRVVWQHDNSFVFGRTKAGTARFSIRDGQMVYEADPPDAVWARDAMESIRRGDVDRSSFAFVVGEDDQRWEKVDGVVIRTILRAKLREAGPQTFPAYESTAASVRSFAASLHQVPGAGDADVLWREFLRRLAEEA